MASHNVLVFHPDAETRRWIADSLHTSNGRFRVVADTGSMTEAVVLSRFYLPNVAFLGAIRGPEMAEFVREVANAAPGLHVVGYAEDDDVSRDLVPGLRGWVTRPRKAQKLVELLEKHLPPIV